jgi:hypothetical protein
MCDYLHLHGLNCEDESSHSKQGVASLLDEDIMMIGLALLAIAFQRLTVVYVLGYRYYRADFSSVRVPGKN